MGVAGGSARREYERRLALHKKKVKRALPFVVAAAIVGGTAGWLLAASVAPGLERWLALALGGSAALSLWPNRQSVDAHVIGAIGEEEVGSQLGKLPGEFKVFHDVKIPGRRANIDHLVIGPTSVFTVETKAVSGQVSIRSDQIYLGSRKKSYVEQAWGAGGECSRSACRATAHVRPQRRSDLVLYQSGTATSENRGWADSPSRPERRQAVHRKETNCSDKGAG